MVTPWEEGETYRDANNWRVTILSTNAINKGYPIVGEVRLYGDTYALSYYSTQGVCLDSNEGTLTLVKVDND